MLVQALSQSAVQVSLPKGCLGSQCRRMVDRPLQEKEAAAYTR